MKSVRKKINKSNFIQILPFFVFLGVLSLFIHEIMFGWSSATIGGGAFATHQFLGKVALMKLKEHPAMRLYGVRFPSDQEIAKYSGVSAQKNPKGKGFSLKVVGEGPDNLDNSYDSWHFYNPRTGEGKAPEQIAILLEELKKKLLESKNPDEAAKEAAYLAHFIQDMTCPFHTVGMPKKELRLDQPQGSSIVGPYRNFNAAEWRKIAEVAKNHIHKGPGGEDKSDWFDPNYHDGPSWLPIEGSTHYVYEGAIEWLFKSVWSYSWEERMKNSIGDKFLSEEYPTKMKPDEFAKAVALKTRDRLDNKLGNLAFDSRDFQKKFFTLFQTEDIKDFIWTLFVEKLWDTVESFTDVTNVLEIKFIRDVSSMSELFPSYIKVPMDDWKRGIRATYTMWRESFSALRVPEDGLFLVKVPDQDNTFKLQVTVVNAEPAEDAYELRGSYSISGGIRSSGELAFEKSTASAFTEGDASKCSVIAKSKKAFRVSDSFIISPGSRQEKVTITLEGKYYNVPDSGKTVQEISLADVDLNTKPMPPVINLRFNKASAMIGTRFKIIITPKKMADSVHKSFVVYEQDPEPGALIGPGDTVRLTIYKEYKYVRVPNVLKHSVSAARPKIEFYANPLDKEPALNAVLPEGTKEDDVVLNTDPEPGTSVPFGSDVRLIIKPKDKPPEEFEQRGETEVESGPEERDELPPPEQDDDSVQLGSITIEPSSIQLSLDKRKSAPLTVTAFDLNGNKVSEEILSKMSFSWSVSDPSIAGIVGSGLRVSVYAIKEGATTAICSTRTQVNTAAVSVVEKGGAGEWDETSEWEVAEGGGEEGETGSGSGSGGRTEGETGSRTGGTERSGSAGEESGEAGGETTRSSETGQGGGETREESSTQDQKDINLLGVPVEEGGDLVGLWSTLEEEDIVHPKRFYEYALAVRVTKQGNSYSGTVLAAGPQSKHKYPIGSKLFEVRRIDKHHFDGVLHYVERYNNYRPRTVKVRIYCNTFDKAYSPERGFFQFQGAFNAPAYSLTKFVPRYRYKNGRILDFFQAIKTWPKEKK
jgi:hypothetical protein